ncbi:MAG: hypothetical protein AseanaTS_29290 [Candidatus Pelagadaptatus aseana]|uniref:hypothetical protein n=1 Tax=Candidatus Pelagadaptatus aseana TaxID=3120508 RepID=UPI0039B35A8F
MKPALVFTLSLYLVAHPALTEELSLPGLPDGLDGGISSDPLPQLPTFDNNSSLHDPQPETFSPWHSEGFLEWRGGLRLQDDPNASTGSINELRLQTAVDYSGNLVTARVTADLQGDALADHPNHIHLNRGEGYIDLREAWLQLPIGHHLDAKLGRQILTWGVGDQLFINDLFPKDWNSFFIGRDQEYLKAPSDALKLAFYFDAINIDLVWTPEFDPDRYIDGQRISYFNAMTGQPAGDENPIMPHPPTGDEWALRLYKTHRGIEYAAYGYRGYWKSPNSFDPERNQPDFARLNAWGASMRSPLAGGIISAEAGYYDSVSDSSGDNPFIANSELRLLLAYERELASNLTGSLQWYLEQLQDYNPYRQSQPAGNTYRDKDRQLVTSRLTWLRMNQNLEWSLFIFYSPTDQDWFAQPKVSYKYSDHLLLTAGFNLFAGEKPSTFFGQFEDNSNAYAGIRYSF